MKKALDAPPRLATSEDWARLLEPGDAATAGDARSGGPVNRLGEGPQGGMREGSSAVLALPPPPRFVPSLDAPRRALRGDATHAAAPAWTGSPAANPSATAWDLPAGRPLGIPPRVPTPDEVAQLHRRFPSRAAASAGLTQEGPSAEEPTDIHEEDQLAAVAARMLHAPGGDGLEGLSDDDLAKLAELFPPEPTGDENR